MVQELLERPDVYHVLNIPDILGLTPILKRAKLVYDIRSPWAEDLRVFGYNRFICWIAEKIEQYLTRHADIVLVVNKTLEKRARQWGAERIYLLPNYPPADFQPTVTPENFKKKQGLSGKRIILFVGKFSTLEGALNIVQVLADVLKEESIVLVMVGDGPERSSIEEFVNSRGISSKVLVTGWVPHKFVPNWIAIADVCVVPLREDMPSAKFYSPHSVRKVGEYLTLGKPLISTPVGEFTQTDLPIKIASLNSFPEAIKEVLRNPPVIDRPDDFTWESSEGTLLEAYEELARSLR